MWICNSISIYLNSNCRLITTYHLPISHNFLFVSHSQHMLQEVAPSIDKRTIKCLAYKLISLRSFKLDKNGGAKKSLLIQLKRLEREMRFIKEVGMKKYTDIIQVTNEIRDVRWKSAIWAKCTQHQQIKIDDVQQDRLPASKALPPAISNLYFKTPLVDVMNSFNTRTSKELPAIDWDALLQTASKHLAAFRELEKEIGPVDIHSFKCKSGSCGFGIPNVCSSFR